MKVKKIMVVMMAVIDASLIFKDIAWLNYVACACAGFVGGWLFMESKQ